MPAIALSDSNVLFTECKHVLLCIAKSEEGDDRLCDMRILFETMCRVAANEDDTSEISVTEEDCLWRAARSGNTEILLYLLRERQVDPNARRALYYARHHNKTEAIRILVAHGATSG